MCYFLFCKNKYQTVRQISEFLGISHTEEFLQSVVEATDINLMRKQHANQGSELRADMEEFNIGPMPIYRKGMGLFDNVMLNQGYRNIV